MAERYITRFIGILVRRITDNKAKLAFFRMQPITMIADLVLNYAGDLRMKFRINEIENLIYLKI